MDTFTLFLGRFKDMNPHCGHFLKKAVLFLLLSTAVIGGRAEAIPAFAKKYSATCTLCHSEWPRLNPVGWKFRQNAYQLEDSRDGALAGKTSPSFDLHLDSGKANPPISLRINGGLSVFHPDSSPAIGPQANNFLCCMEGNTLGFYAAGNVNTDSAFWASYQFGKTGLDQGFIRFANMFGAGYMGIDLGGIRTADSDAVSPNREWFSSSNPAFFGNTNIGAGDQGMGPGYADIGLRFFGNPDYGPFSYDVVIVNGSRTVGQTVNTRGNAYSFMARLDTGAFSGSFRYWNDKSGDLTFTRTAANAYASYALAQSSAAPNVFAPNRQAPDEKTQDYLFTVNYHADRWDLDAVVDINNFSMGTRTDGSGNTYTRGSVRRGGAALAYIYRINPFINGGMRYGTSNTSGFTETYNATPSVVSASTVTMLDFKLEMLPAQNARMSLQWTLDLSNPAARINPDGTTYSQQTKLFLLWDWVF